MLHLDFSQALKATDGDVELLREVIQAFLGEYPVLLAEIEHAIHAEDAVAVQRASHTISGTLRLFGEVAPRQLSRALEAMGRSGDLSVAQPKYEALKASLETFRQLLSESMKTLS
jgi:two-component system, sensor histidine kinase and response regulator